MKRPTVGMLAYLAMFSNFIVRSSVTSFGAQFLCGPAISVMRGETIPRINAKAQPFCVHNVVASQDDRCAIAAQFGRSFVPERIISKRIACLLIGYFLLNVRRVLTHWPTSSYVRLPLRQRVASFSPRREAIVHPLARCDSF